MNITMFCLSLFIVIIGGCKKNCVVYISPEYKPRYMIENGKLYSERDACITIYNANTLSYILSSKKKGNDVLKMIRDNCEKYGLLFEDYSYVIINNFSYILAIMNNISYQEITHGIPYYFYIKIEKNNESIVFIPGHSKKTIVERAREILSMQNLHHWDAEGYNYSISLSIMDGNWEISSLKPTETLSRPSVEGYYLFIKPDLSFHLTHPR